MKHQRLKEFDKVYPLVPLSVALWLIPLLCGILAPLAVWLFGNTEPVGIVITCVASAVLVFVGVLGAYVQIAGRYRRRSKVVAYRSEWHGLARCPLALCVDIEDDQGAYLAATFCEEVYAGGIRVSMVFDALEKAGVKLDGSEFEPVTFVTVRGIGTIGITVGGKWRRCRGIAKGRDIEIEFHRDPYVMLSLFMHELAHIALASARPKMNERDQHKLMGHVGL